MQNRILFILIDTWKQSINLIHFYELSLEGVSFAAAKCVLQVPLIELTN